MDLIYMPPFFSKLSKEMQTLDSISNIGLISLQGRPLIEWNLAQILSPTGYNSIHFLLRDNDRWLREYLSRQKTKQVALPYWSQFENKLIKISHDKSEPFNQGIIPFWLKSDLNSGQL